MNNRDCGKGGQHNLGGSVKHHGNASFHSYADGGSVSVPIPKLDPAASARATARESKKPEVDDTPKGRSFFDVVKDRGKDLMDAEDRMVKGAQGKANGGMVRRYEDGGFVDEEKPVKPAKEPVKVTATDPFKSNDDGGGGAMAARESYETKQAESKKPVAFTDADTANSAAPAPKPAPAPAPAPAAEAAPSAMPAKITTLTEAEKTSATPAAEPKKQFRMTGNSKAAQSFNAGAASSSKKAEKKDAKAESAGDSEQSLASDTAKAKPTEGGRASKGKAIGDTIRGAFSAVGKALTPDAQRNKKYK